MTVKYREAIFAGKFYPGNKRDLEQMFSSFYKTGYTRDEQSTIQAIIVPHAGYMFSGKVASKAFSLIDSEKKFDNVFILGTSHSEIFNGASVFPSGNYENPLGDLPVNEKVTKDLLTDPNFLVNEKAHLSEHSIEVQLPFLSHYLTEGFNIVPILIGTRNAATCATIASKLQHYFNNDNLFVISSDFSHYPPYEEANKIDMKTAELIVSNNPEQFLEFFKEEGDYDIPGLATKACGWPGILVLMYLNKERKYQFKKLLYQNSGDSSHGGKSQVVGYHAIALVSN
jgi:hypothetical protein